MTCIRRPNYQNYCCSWSGKTDSYRGKCLDDINLDLEQDLLENAQGHDNYDSDELIDYDAALPTEKSKETEFTDDNPVLTPQSTLLSDATNATHIKTKKKTKPCSLDHRTENYS
ncbi:unnamed protein product [Parnassius apollo]|uniref:(apollo) hypothetical protein n=1 Tax=Parnassius apollo TaxID=110799 RepID=A0A8S3WTW8_PARAO|nr:unnamed protein product [Parnassius apollo]